MAKYGERNTILRKHGVTEDELAQLRELDWEEAMWRMRHERKVFHEWVNERFDFIIEELKKARPEMPVFKPSYDGPPIVSHRHGRGGSSAQRYGEKFG